MKFLEEVVTEEFLPTFRSMLAADLRDRGLTQATVAERLGISQSAVSKYAQGDVKTRPEVANDRRVQEHVEELGAGLASGDMRPVQALIETEILIRRLSRGDDLLASLHEAEMPELADVDYDFSAVEPESDALLRERTLSSVRRGLRILEQASGFAGLIPQVGSNLVECLPEADSIHDVAGVPGRLFDVRGRIEIPGEPDFGVSEHVASVLLAARSIGSDARAGLNIAYDPEIVRTLEDLGYETIEFDVGDGSASAAIRSLEAIDPGGTVLYHTGGFGVEPNVYILGDSASQIADLTRDLL
ncbi:MAG: thiamine-phosphate synthase family protein [Halodesulfurarchaeum sp.]